MSVATTIEREALKGLGWQQLTARKYDYGGRSKCPLISVYSKGLFRLNRMANEIVDLDYVEVWFNEEKRLLAFRPVPSFGLNTFKLGLRKNGAREFTSKALVATLRLLGVMGSDLKAIPERHGDLIILNTKTSG